MKKFITIGLIVLSLFSFTSCARAVKDFSADFTYTDPQQEGGYWTVYSCNQVFRHCKCIYWGAEGDENAKFRTESGQEIFVNGTYLIVKED